MKKDSAPGGGSNPGSGGADLHKHLDLFPPAGSLSCIYQAKTLFFILGENKSATLQQWSACYLSVSLLPPFQEVRVIYGLIYMRRQAAARSSRAAEGKSSMQKQIRGRVCARSVAFRDRRRLWESHYWAKKKEEPSSIQPVNFPLADVCSGAPAGVASRRFISPSKRPSH